MKKLFLIICFPVALHGQSVEIENAYVNKCIADKVWSPQQIATNGKLWQQLRNEYPVLPYDTATQQMMVSKVISFPGVKKDVAYQRVKQWAALNFGELAAVMEYENEPSGKIILEGFSKIHYVGVSPGFWGGSKPAPTSVDLYYSLVVTIKDDRAKVEYKNLRYKNYIAGYGAAGYYVPGEYVTTHFASIFPVVAKPSDEWRASLDLLRKSMDTLNATAPDMEGYIRSVEADNKF